MLHYRCVPPLLLVDYCILKMNFRVLFAALLNWEYKSPTNLERKTWCSVCLKTPFLMCSIRNHPVETLGKLTQAPWTFRTGQCCGFLPKPSSFSLGSHWLWLFGFQSQFLLRRLSKPWELRHSGKLSSAMLGGNEIRKNMQKHSPSTQPALKTNPLL